MSKHLVQVTFHIHEPGYVCSEEWLIRDGFYDMAYTPFPVKRHPTDQTPNYSLWDCVREEPLNERERRAELIPDWFEKERQEYYVFRTWGVGIDFQEIEAGISGNPPHILFELQEMGSMRFRRLLPELLSYVDRQIFSPSFMPDLGLRHAVCLLVMMEHKYWSYDGDDYDDDWYLIGDVTDQFSQFIAQFMSEKI